ncbi:phage portal protein [Mycolicibacterium moriokaense]|uniref:phage portal protein n=1 Tax=Mycolicibacterium moriokaense TaxID=39691 RepID=UPI0009F7271C|nr:phage portal protein [Mycolicibacterium moriokaense]MCV7041239.1 phage portal protein [Mycolicibacterium moriokaense]
MLTTNAVTRMVDFIGSPLTGAPVDECSVLGLSAVYRAVSLIAGGIATLPLRVVQESDGVTERVPSWLDKPAGGLTRYELVETTLLHLLLWGNAYLAHIYNNAGALSGVSPIHPSAVCVEIDYSTSAKTYRVSLEDGTTRAFTDLSMTHIKWLSSDGYVGLSPLTLARSGAFGIALAADRSASRLFNGGALMSAIATVDEEMDEESAKAIKEGLDRRIAGEPNAGKIAFINRKVNIHPWTISNEDLQWIQAREFQIEEIARIYGVPATLIGLSDKQSSWGTGIREMHQAMARWTFMPWTTRIEQRLSLLLPPNRKAEFDYRDLLAPDPQTEIELLIKQVQAGLLSHAEARQILNRRPLPESERPQAQEPQEPNDES